MLHLAEKSRHQSVCLWIILPLLHLLADFAFAFLLSAAKGKPQKLVSTSLLSRLLDQDVGEEVFVALYESLRVHLAVFDLFFSVALDALEETLECLLLSVLQLFQLFGQGLLEFSSCNLSLQDLLLFYHNAHPLGLIVVLNSEVNPFLLLHVDELFAVALLVHKTPRYILFLHCTLLILF